ncbi:ABC transporter ATP-binding protein [Rhodococcus sp. RS1C4]|uniref:ABC transporter ATP-binding protein n=1 Tax=Nocardiaceae TaxID=85025 RepID=UPI00036EF3C4|nr:MULTISPECIES: ABC transporter ATP-binding protein [Rhodococcus]OZC49956.1 ABC transporter ATP-binding protein [Rhodococcus sp. 06-621-2]OZC54474.1 ABC transporter ATP-binding protein [Rhodococcus sp. RS1C4]OZC75572.1 ABC transporter ATP-binding protein [Rhodococcus sp. 06-418-1B]OZD12261.1 ABC transporter ATP-binding protein [Rhodococcus sp. 06-156-3C]OZD19072.1 ABC transporter ATP-binding protein [Rhodococcus sp. 06-156-4C]
MTIEAASVRWSRGHNQILDGVDFDPHPGETVGLIGPNGSGKSSLLRILAGIVSPDSGDVTLDGAPMASMRRKQIARRVAMVDQHSDTEVDIAVRDVVRLGRIPHHGLLGGDSAADDVAVDKALTDTGMTSKANRLWHTLSGGERQRTQIARALAQEPTELLLDEPTNHLDIQHQLDILALISGLPLTSFIALHDLNLASMFCDRIVVLQAGKVVAVGRPSDVITQDLVQEVYHVRASVELDETGTYPQVTYKPLVSRAVR